MNKVLMSLLFGTFILTGTSFAQPAPAAAPAAPVAPVAATEVAKPVHHEHHSEITKALHKLKDAKSELEKAAKDFGGHKVKAIEAIDKAIEELKAAKDFDKK